MIYSAIVFLPCLGALFVGLFGRLVGPRPSELITTGLSIVSMDEDPWRPRFFSYLSGFTFAMLMLVTADNLVQLFFGWEGVGLFSYLLIGFWYQKPEANAAAIKAFVVNRVGGFA